MLQAALQRRSLRAYIHEYLLYASSLCLLDSIGPLLHAAIDRSRYGYTKKAPNAWHRRGSRYGNRCFGQSPAPPRPAQTPRATNNYKFMKHCDTQDTTPYRANNFRKRIGAPADSNSSIRGLGLCRTKVTEYPHDSWGHEHQTHDQRKAKQVGAPIPRWESDPHIGTPSTERSLPL